MPEDGSPNDPRFAASIDLLRRSGLGELQVRYHDDEKPTIWMAVGKWGDAHEAAAALSPLDAVVRLLERALDGGVCAYCTKPSGVSTDWKNPPPLAGAFCWWLYDPETEKFRRGCEGEHDEKQIRQTPPKGGESG